MDSKRKNAKALLINVLAFFELYPEPGYVFICFARSFIPFYLSILLCITI